MPKTKISSLIETWKRKPTRKRINCVEQICQEFGTFPANLQSREI